MNRSPDASNGDQSRTPESRLGQRLPAQGAVRI